MISLYSPISIGRHGAVLTDLAKKTGLQLRRN
jgi:hypothetical protein